MFRKIRATKRNEIIFPNSLFSKLKKLHVPSLQFVTYSPLDWNLRSQIPFPGICNSQLFAKTTLSKTLMVKSSKIVSPWQHSASKSECTHFESKAFNYSNVNPQQISRKNCSNFQFCTLTRDDAGFLSVL